jgi:predicted acyl esterase
MSDGVTLYAEPFEQEVEITGPLAARFPISSTTTDTDLFLVLQLLDPEGRPVHFNGATEPKQPISQGWLRASHRALSASSGDEYQPVRDHEVVEPLVPGEIYEVDVEVWPTCIVAPAGYQLALTIQGEDYDHGEGGVMTNLGFEIRGSGFNMHDDPVTRPADIYAGEVTLHSGSGRDAYLLVPFIPTA